MTSPPLTLAEDEQVHPGHGLLLFYRVMAFVTAALLLVLVFIGVPLQIAASSPQVVNVVGTMHGFLYIVYLVAAFQLTRRLSVPKWQMGLVLLAGTLPFCAFVAERKMTRRYETIVGPAGGASRDERRAKRASLKARWLSKRAILLHFEVAVLAPGCVVAGWWQATRALAGNLLSWVYSIEWPIFALLAAAGWWHLVHEDPAAYKARRRQAAEPSPQPSLVEKREPLLSREQLAGGEARMAAVLAALVGFEFALGIAAMVSLPLGRPAGFLPRRGEAIYVAHAVFGLVVALAAVAVWSRLRTARRAYRMVGWMSLVGTAIAGLGGLLTASQSLVRFLGIACMFVGPLLVGLGYLVPVLARSSATEVVAGS
jgi:integral membrane protein